MKYILIHNLEENIKEKTLKSFIKEEYQIIYEDEKNIIIKKNKEKIIDEDIYIKITLSIIKRNEIIKNSKGKIIDITEAFEYAKTKEKYNKFNNKFDWYIRNIITKEIIN
ncbi:MAG: hypothetical protein IKF91_01490 [Bacilli bacterium]|nr:hypothetical protein [Bacilli bacterium]